MDFNHFVINTIGVLFLLLLLCFVLLLIGYIINGIGWIFTTIQNKKKEKNEPFFEDFEFGYVKGSDYEWESESDD